MHSSYFAINYECNHRCLFCPNRSEKYRGDIELDEFKESLNTILSKSDVNHITISGGEPTLNKDFIEILKFATNSSITVGLFSNSDRFSNKDFAEEFVNSVNIDRLVVTTPIYSHYSHVHDEITQSSGSFERIVAGIENLTDKNIMVPVKNCINKLNYDHIDEYINFVIKEPPNVGRIGLYGLDNCRTKRKSYG